MGFEVENAVEPFDCLAFARACAFNHEVERAQAFLWDVLAYPFVFHYAAVYSIGNGFEGK